MKNNYLIPKSHYIARDESTEGLYKAEQKMKDAIHQVGYSLGKLHDEPLTVADASYWNITLPRALLSALDSFERGAAEAAAISLLRQRGFLVTIPENHHATFGQEL